MPPITPIGVTPYLVLSDAAAAIAFYQRAFGAQEQHRFHAEGTTKILHARLEIFGSLVLLSDDFPEYAGGRSRTPEALGGCPITLHLQVEDADAIWAEALANGAEVVMPLREQFWGDYYGQVRDPFGYTWSLSHGAPR